MINLDQKKKPEKKHRKQGGAYDTLARVLSGIVRAVFRNGTIMEDRPGVGSEDQVVGAETFVKSPSVFEIYQPNRATDGYNLLNIGRKGTGKFNNTNYIQLNVDSDTAQERSGANGQFRLTMSQDGIVQRARFNFYSLDTAVKETEFSGPRFGFITELEDGANTGFQVVLLSGGSLKYGIAVDNEGIQMYGLPSSDPGYPGALYTSTISTGTGSYSNVLRVSTG